MMIDGIKFDFPAVTLSIAGKIYTPDSEFFECEDLTIKTSWQKRGDFLYKRVEVESKKTLPTPDYLEVDRQTIDDEKLRSCGYIPTSQERNITAVDEEGGGGIFSGCGYPLIGSNIFIGMAHPAAFSTIVEEKGSVKTWSLRHHPIWQGNKLEVVEAVLGISDDPYSAFDRYIDEVRVKLPLEPYIAFCSFWSDPYSGNYEYVVTEEGMQKFIKSYEKLGLFPDAYTFDAGWANRQSIFEPKAGLELENYPKLSLWVSHNGPMGIDPEYLKSQGYAVGKGRSCGYCGEGYGVLLDPRLEEAIGNRFAELAKHVSHFKIDWDNECAVNDEYKEKYPTRNHVCEGFVNAVGRIIKKARKVNPALLTRVGGFWPSPWWLVQGQQVFVTNSGDSEYISLPTLRQRAAAATHRDFMYYNLFVRDKTMIPLNSLDNHEFTNSIRNVFLDDDNMWVDNLMHCIMRGSTYFTWTIQPESLSMFKAHAMKKAMQFIRDYKHEFIVKHGTMFGGNPGRGEVYGFKQNNWIMVRNPAPLPQYFDIPSEWGKVVQFYPDFRKAEGKILLLPEELKVMMITDLELPETVPFQVADGKRYFPASVSINENVGPWVAKLHQVPEIVFSKATFDEENGNLLFSLTTPYRMNPLELRLACPDDCKIRAVASRYAGIRTTGASFAPAVTHIPAGVPGYGENRNAEFIWNGKTSYYSIPVPPGGETFYTISFGRKIKLEDFELWCFGYEDRTREGIDCDTQLLTFDKSMPLQHPAGFPRAVKFEL